MPTYEEFTVYPGIKRAALEEQLSLSAPSDELREEVERLRAQLAQATDPDYLAGALEKIGVVDAEWKARAEAAEAREQAALKALEDEREACAKIVESFGGWSGFKDPNGDVARYALTSNIAATIRARSVISSSRKAP